MFERNRILIGGSIVIISISSWAAAFLIARRKQSKGKAYKEAIRRKQTERSKEFTSLAQEFPLNDDYLRIINLSTDELVLALQNRSLLATNVLRAYLAKALHAQEEFNCITEFVPNALDLAKELDKSSKIQGPLHGLPICIKDDTNIAGMDSTLGFGKNLYRPAAESAVLVQVLQDLGAIPFCKTNVPQSLLSYGSENPIFGTTLNCLDKNLSPGGSSSGTGCLVGASGAVFGTGTDIGGSGRIPAHFNGICSIKPTPNRISGKGIVQAIPNCVGLVGVPSILAKRATILADVFKAITSTDKQVKLDPLALPIPWRSDVFDSKTKLRIGYYTSLSAFPPIGDTEKTVKMAKEALESLGHTLVHFPMPDTLDLSIYEKLMFADDGLGVLEAFKGEVLCETLKPLYRFVVSLNSWSKLFWSWFGFRTDKKQHIWNYMAEKTQMINTTLKAMMEAEIDVILCPAFPFPALRPRDSFLRMAVSYTLIFNVLDFPAGIVPFGKESGENIANYDDRGIEYLAYAKQAIQHSIGLPIGVQIVGKPFMEEQVLRVLVELDRFKGN